MFSSQVISINSQMAFKSTNNELLNRYTLSTTNRVSDFETMISQLSSLATKTEKLEQITTKRTIQLA